MLSYRVIEKHKCPHLIASSDTPGDHQPHDPSEKTVESNEESINEDDDDNDPEMMQFSELQEIEERLDILSEKDNTDIEDLHTLFRDIIKQHDQAIENLEETLQKYL